MTAGTLPLEHEQCSHPDIVSVATSLVDSLKRKASETSAMANVPQSTIEELEAGGLFELLVPRVNGGLEVDLATYMETIVEVGRGDGSVAWTLDILTGASWLVSAAFPPGVSEEVFDGKNRRVSSVLAPRSVDARFVGGGVEIKSGVWSFNSGFAHSHWNVLGLPVRGVDGLVEIVMVVLPSEQCRPLEDWDTFGLRGSGSTSVEVKDVFIPHNRVISMDRILRDDYPSTHLTEASIFRVPVIPFFVTKLLFPSLGMAKAALETALHRANNRGIAYTGHEKQSDAPITHYQFAEAAAKIETAEVLLKRAINSMMSTAKRGERLNMLDRVRIMRDGGFVNRLLWEAIDSLATTSGGNFAQNDNEMSGIWRNAKVASLHGGTSTNTNFELFGRVLSGKEPGTALL